MNDEGRDPGLGGALIGRGVLGQSSTCSWFLGGFCIAPWPWDGSNEGEFDGYAELDIGIPPG